MAARTHLISVVVNPNELRVFDALAQMDERSRSDTIRRILLAEAERRGLKVAAEMQPQPERPAA